MTPENGHLHLQVLHLLRASWWPGDRPGWAEGGRAPACVSGTQPQDSISLDPRFSFLVGGRRRCRIEDFFRALSSSKLCDCDLRVVPFIINRLCLVTSETFFGHYISYYQFLCFEMFRERAHISVAIFLRGPSGKDSTDLGWELGRDVAQFLKTTHAAPDSSSDPQKAGRKEQASSSLDQRISGGLEGTLIRPRGHV